ncbi:5-deoxy-glucuronate isomerase [Microbacterium suaedae]|uniref:5-deoxy-glucuronate isomerase n=1 Tax=Microbacterium suaedae TaxID=2067813 RepID=UPI000DA261BD|nr:5-deoxy-glucuronate isomerase [Microbacterium suaedae]
MGEYRIPAGETAHDEWAMDITPERAGWAYSGIRSLSLDPGQAVSFSTAGDEVMLVPLEGGYRVGVDGEGDWDLVGRAGVFDGPTDVLYVPRDAHVTVTAVGGGRLAIPTARAENRFPVQYVAADDVPVFVRGAGAWSRRVRDFGNASVVDADHLIAVEVINPGGNWSGIPRHKHDTAGEHESQLEEIYYFEAAPTPGADGYGLMRVSSSEAGEIDVAEEVRSGDAVLVPFGWHGPVTAPPESDLYYLNVMAGSTGRSWNITNIDEDAWVAKRWESLDPDPRATREGRPSGQ